MVSITVIVTECQRRVDSEAALDEVAFQGRASRVGTLSVVD